MTPEHTNHHPQPHPTQPHHTQGDRPLVFGPEDLPLVERVPLADRDLPPSTYELLSRAADAHCGATALHLLGENGRRWSEPDTWTYGDLLRHVHQAANALLASGLRPGEPVGLLLPNSGWAYAALLGAQAIGIANPVNPLLAEDHITDILALTGARVVITVPQLAGKARRVAERLPAVRAVLDIGDLARLAGDQPGDRLLTGHRPRPDDFAAYFHTGGTTGTPKVAPHTHAMEVYMAWALGCTGAFLGDSVALAGLPLFHVNAVHVTGLGPFMHGRPVVSLGPLGYRDRALMADFWRIVEHFRVTSFSAVPTVYAALPLVPDGVDISSLRAGAVGAAPLPQRVRSGFESDAKVPMLEGYGLTEATCASAATPAFAPRAGSVGLRLPYQQIKAVRVDADERPTGDCAPGETGVLAISGPAVFPGYLGPGGPDRGGKVVDGWLLTGDLGRVDADGYVYLTGRAKDLIIRGGHNIDPRPVEESLLAHPLVTGAAVVGRPDDHAGEVPVAYVTASARIGADELLAWARERAPEPAAAPKAVHIVDELPTTSIGKIFKPALVADAVRRMTEEGP
ncbi:AMP-binding protein [Actinomadura rudentiformis]|uniref:AMP-binding protein n=1 Tax=Actinomadura rudentiformis TaxID=359158 RepID=A0A6H9YXH0_9ACTN|nr:AMP-binding protein [Actinomadura rudentiformis]KAB2352154.1 AMP-binding protein [Actinomadura rudentiformis]